jgi:molecular chaperone DnaK (HSP70)
MQEKNGKPHAVVEVGGKETMFAPEEVSAMILAKMKSTAEAYLGKVVGEMELTPFRLLW